MFYFCAKIEEEIAQLPKIEQKEFMKVYGMETSGLDRIITECFHRLGLISFLTAGKIEVKAWPIKKGLLLPKQPVQFILILKNCSSGRKLLSGKKMC